MDQETCENVRQLCMLAAHEQSEENLTSIVAEIYRLVSTARAEDLAASPGEWRPNQ